MSKFVIFVNKLECNRFIIAITLLPSMPYVISSSTVMLFITTIQWSYQISITYWGYQIISHVIKFKVIIICIIIDCIIAYDNYNVNTFCSCWGNNCRYRSWRFSCSYRNSWASGIFHSVNLNHKCISKTTNWSVTK